MPAVADYDEMKRIVWLLLVLLLLPAWVVAPLWAATNVDIAAVPDFGGVPPHSSPTVVATSTISMAVAENYQCKTFIGQGREWVFAVNSTDIVYYSRVASPVGAWDVGTNFSTSGGSGGYIFSLWWDGSDVHTVWTVVAASQPVYYRVGTPLADGTISWGADQIAKAGVAGQYQLYPSVCVDTSGYPVVTYSRAGAIYVPYVMIASAVNGTAWADAEVAMDATGGADKLAVLILPLPGRDLLAIWENRATAKVNSKYYDFGVGWGAIKVVAAYVATTYNYPAVAYDTKAVALIPVAGGNVNAYTWTLATDTWDAGVAIDVGTGAAIFKTGDKAFGFVRDGANIYSIAYNGTTWGTPTLLDATTNFVSIRDFSAGYSYAPYLGAGVLWLEGAGSPYSITYDNFQIDPPTVTSSAATDITGSTATLYGVVSASNGTQTYVGFEWDTNSGTPYATSWNTTYTTEAFNHGIAGLPSATTIYWRAFALNEGGTGYSGELNFTTLGSIPAVDALPATAVSYTTATLGGNITDLNGSGNCTARGFELDTVMGGPYSHDWHEDGSFDTGTYNLSVTGLEADTIYYFRAYATNVVGTNYSTELNFTTLAFVVPTVACSPAGNITAFGANLSGNITDSGGVPVDLIGFEWGTTTGVYTNNWTGVIESYDTGASGSWSVYGQSWRSQTFTTNMTYTIDRVYIRVNRVGTPGNVTASIQVTVAGEPVGFFGGVDLCSGNVTGDNLPTTLYEWLEIPFDTPLTLNINTQYALIVKGLTGNATDYITWRADQELSLYAGGNIVSSGDAGFSWTTYADRDFMFRLGIPSAFDYTFTDMPWGTTIYWRAFAVNEAGIGYCGEGSFDTLTPVPLCPTNFVVIQTGESQVTLTWVMGTYATDILIRMRETTEANPFSGGVGPPTTLTEGIEVYSGNGTATNYTMTISELGTYGFSAWSSNAAGNSTCYATATLGGEYMFLMLLGILALGLTVAMFATKNSMLGFPSGIFWAVFSGGAYMTSTATWDLYYLLFFAAAGMFIFTIFAAFALRKRDLAGPDADKGAFIDEGGKRPPKTGQLSREWTPAKESSGSWGDIDRLGMHDMDDNPAAANNARERLQDRARKRRAKVSWGEFK